LHDIEDDIEDVEDDIKKAQDKGTSGKSQQVGQLEQRRRRS
jgi:hypothetical protein